MSNTAAKSQNFSTKLRLFQESCAKLFGGAGNLPSSSDIIGFLKFFQSTLQNISKEIHELQIERFCNRNKDEQWRTQNLPQLDYGELYLCLLNLSENIQKLTNQAAICEHILRTLHNLLIFLDYDCLEGIPLALAWMLVYFPVAVQPSIVELMCSVVIPLIYNAKDDQESYAMDSVPAILTLVFQHVEKIEYHVWVLESFLSKKKELHKDLLMIIAYGPTEARLPAVCLLFHYWPETCPSVFHGNQTLQPVHYVWEPWKPLTCDRTDCPNKAGKALAMKMTVNPRIAAQHGGKPPPLYVCLDCADALNRRDFDQLVDILLPSKQISLTCESKTCRSKNNQASVTCWSPGCTFLTGNRAIRFCEACHTLRHSYGQAGSGQMHEEADSANVTDSTSRIASGTGRSTHPGFHAYQMPVPEVWDMALDLQSCMVEAIVSLTRETMPRWRQVLLGGADASDDRAVAGLTCTGANAPGGPPTGGDMILLGVSTSATATGLSMVGGVGAAGAMGTAGPGTISSAGLGLTGSTHVADFGVGQQNASGTRGTAGVTGVGVNTGSEAGELSLLGRYSDEDHKVLAVYGALLVGEKCKPREFVNIELLTRITAGIFKWFVDTIYTAEVGTSYDGRGTLRQRYELGDLLERVKSEYILKWVQEVQRLHPEAIFAVLLPHPLEYARVGSCWDALCDRTTQVKHGLSRIGSLIPYDIVTFETWDFIMPYWLETIRTEVPRSDYFELEVLLKKIFDATAGPFPFLPQKVYHFAAERFTNTPVAVQDQALAWLEILTSVEVPIPMKELLTMFRNGVESFQIDILLPPPNTGYDVDDLDVDDDDNEDEQDTDADSVLTDGEMTHADVSMSALHPRVAENVKRKQPRTFGKLDRDGGTDGLFSEKQQQRETNSQPASEEDDEPQPDETVGLLQKSRESATGSSLRKAHKRPSRANKHERSERSKSTVARTESGIRMQEEFAQSQQQITRKHRQCSQPPLSSTTTPVAATTGGRPLNATGSTSRRTHRPSRTRRRQSEVREYRATECLAQMLNIAYRQLKFHDPFGHTGYAQETPQLLLSLLGDMLQLYWGHEGAMPQRGLRHLCCAGHDTCILPGPNATSATGAVDEPPGGVRTGTPAVSGSPAECLDCLDMLTWLNYADLICQHMAPLRPSPKASTEFSVEALTKAAEFPEYTDWRVMRDTDSISQSQSDDLPNPTELASMPSVLRVVYLLICFLRDPTKAVANTVSSHAQTAADTIVVVDTDPDGSSRPADLSNAQMSRDPIVLQCIIECLVYLCHIGDCLQQLLNKAEKSLAVSNAPGTGVSTSTAVSGSTAGTTTTTTTTTTTAASSAPAGTVVKPSLSSKISGSGGAQTPGGAACGVCTATPQAQYNFIHYLVHCHLIPSLWSLLKSDLSHLASWVVPLLLHSLSFPGGAQVFWRLIETDFGHADWRVRFDAIEKTTILLRELDPVVLAGGFSGAAGMKINSILSGGSMASASGVNLFGRPATGTHSRGARGAVGRMVTGKAAPALPRSQAANANQMDSMSKPGAGAAGTTNENPLVRTALAHAFCCLIGSLDDSHSIIAQYTSTQLASLNSTALLCGIQCLEFQFDAVVIDRCLILQRMHQLSCILPDRQVFTWDFFVNRFGLLALQAQMSTLGQQDIDSVTDLNGYHRNSQHFQNQFERACFAIARSGGLRSISQTSRAQARQTSFSTVRPSALACGPSQSRPGTEAVAGAQSTNAQRHPSVDSTMATTNTEPETSTFRPHGSRFHGSRRSRMSMASFSGLFPTAIAGAEFMDSNNKFLSSIRNALDQDSSERDTLHQWVRLLLKFMASLQFDLRLDETGGGSSSTGRHNAGSNAKDELRDRKALSKAQRHLAFLLGYSDGSFNMPPHRMRNSTVFHSFLAHVGGVLDRNFGMGSCILHQTLVVLQFCASPQRYATDAQPPTFTLRLLDPQARLHWLQTLLVILYKYEYSAPGGTIHSGLSGTSGTGSNSHSAGTLSSGPLGPVSSGTGRLRKSSSEAQLLDNTDEGVRRSTPPIGPSSGTTSGGTCPNALSSSGTVGAGSGVAGNPLFSTPHHYMGTGGGGIGGGGVGASATTGTTNLPAGGTRGLVEYLIQIVLNTMDAQVHVCRERTEDEPFEPPTPPMRLREVSNVSGDFTTIVETDTPPASPVKLADTDRADEILMPGVTVTIVDPEQESADREAADLDGSTLELATMANRSDETQSSSQPSPERVGQELKQAKRNNGMRRLSKKQKSESAHSARSTHGQPESVSKTPSTRTRSAVTVDRRDQQLGKIARDTETVSPLSPESSSSTICEMLETSGPVPPATVSRDEQAIHAPILPEGIEMSILKEPKALTRTANTHAITDAQGSSGTELKVGKRTVFRGMRKVSPEVVEEKATPTDGSSTTQTGRIKPTHDTDPGAETHRGKPMLPEHSMSADGAHPQSTHSERHLHTAQSQDSGCDSRQPHTLGAELGPRAERKRAGPAAPVPPSAPTQPKKPPATVSRSGSSANVASVAATAALTTERCPWCKQILERYDESTLGLGMVCLATFVHREPSLAAPYLRDMLLTAARLAGATLYSWQSNLSHIIVPGNVSSIARQFLRCTMYNLAPNGLFVQLFQTPIPDELFFKCIISVLVDFEDHMSFFQPILLLLEALNKRKSLPSDTMPVLLTNLASYLEYLPNLTDDVKTNHFLASGWADIIGPLEVFLRKLPTLTPVPGNVATTVRIMTYILRSPVASNFKTLPDTFAAVLRLVVENVHFKLSSVIELCSLSNRTLKERTKMLLSKTLVELFHQAIKFRVSIPDENIVKLLQFILMDAGGTIEPNQVVEGLTTLFNPQTYHLFSTGAAELMRPHLPDCIAFISDVHTMHKVKQAQKSAIQLNAGQFGASGASGPSGGLGKSGMPTSSGSVGGLLNTGTGLTSSGLTSTGTTGGAGAGGGFGGTTGLISSLPSLHEDVLGAHLKSGLAQYVSLELSRSSSCNDQDVLSMLSPGLLVDIRPIKSTGFLPSGAPQRLRPPIIQTNPPGTATGAHHSVTANTGEASSNKPTRSSGSIASRQSDDSTCEKGPRPADTTLIVITPSVENSCMGSGMTLENQMTRMATPHGSTSTSGSGSTPKVQSPVSPAVTVQPPSVTVDAPSTTAIASSTPGSAPGAPGTASSRLTTTYGHVTLAPTFSQTSQIDAPILHHLPWLKCIPPSSQLGPRDFLIMVERVRTLSWILLGATMNMALTREATGLACRPIPFVLVRSVADLVKALLSSFPDQQKQSVTVMSSLYHAFLLCQIWTVYCEAAASLSPSHTTQHKVAIATAVDFWTRIMPTVLRLLSISEDFVIVSGRLLSVIEELVECQCSIVTKLFPIWIPMFCGRHRQLPGNMLKRLQKCVEWEPPEAYNRLLLLLSLPEPNSRSETTQSGGASNGAEKAPSFQTNTPSMPGLSAPALLACQANTLMGCNPLMKSIHGPPEEGIPVCGAVQCAGHALASSTPYASDGVGTGVGIGAGALGTDLLTSRLVAWLKKHIFVLGRNEDQHSTATHIFVH